MAHIFLSHTRHDHQFAVQLAVQLQQRGLVVLPVSDPTAPERAQPPYNSAALETASHVLVILSPAAVASEETEHDWERALDLNQHLIVILRETCDIPARLQALPRVDFRGPFLLAVEDLVKRLLKTKAPTRPLTVEHPPPVEKEGLLPIALPAERCWREDRLRINYILPIILSSEELAARLPAFLVAADFELVRSTTKTFRGRRLRGFPLFDPRRAEHTLTVKQRKGSLRAYYRMTRTQVYHWLPAHYRTLDREAAALYRYLATGTLDNTLAPVREQARIARVMSWIGLTLIVLVALAILFLLLADVPVF